MVNKLRKNAGETIPETLVAVLIMAMAFLMLTGAVVTAARINSSVRNNEMTVSNSSQQTVDTAYAITVKYDDTAQQMQSTLYQTENGYYYYE